MNVELTTVDAEIAQAESRIAGWRSAAAAIQSWAEEAHDAHAVRTTRLVKVEEIAGQIYREIDRLTASLNRAEGIDDLSSERVSRTLTTLQLVLMEITEQGTSMYSVASEETSDVSPLAAPQASTTHDARGGQYTVGYFARKHRLRRDEAREILLEAGASRDRANELARDGR